MTGFSPGLQKKILSARSLNGSPPTESIVPYRNIRNLMETRVDRYEDHPYLIFFDEDGHRTEYSYREFYEQACKSANLLLANGIRSGDRIATLAYNHSDTVVQYFGAFLIGAVVVPLNVGEDDDRLSYILNNSGTRLLFVRQEFIDRVKRIRPGLRHLEFVISVGSQRHDPYPHFHEELARQSASLESDHQPSLSDESLIVYTSGTTGDPKGVVLLQYNLLVDAMAIADWHALSPEQRMMCVLPIHHVNGTIVTLLTPMYAGCSVVLNQKFHTDRFFERISNEKIHVVSVVPTLLQFLLHADVQIENYNLGHFRHIICGAGPLTVDLAQKFERHFSIPIIHGYGLSETTCYSCFLPVDLDQSDHDNWLTKHGFPSIGVPLPVNEMAIHDEQGNEMTEGERGEIVIRGHNIMKYYFQNPEANESTFANGWFRSGDEGFFLYDDQERKFFFITGRLKELIIRGGVNISPLEIDEVLMNIQGVQAGIAVGFENEWYGEEVGAYVQLKEGSRISEEEIIRACRKELSFAKSPKVVVFGEEVPVTSTGKYQRNRCKELFVEWKSVQFRDSK